MNSITQVPDLINEPVLEYGPGSAERISIKKALDQFLHQTTEVPLRIGGDKVKTGHTVDILCPHDHSLILGRYHCATAEHVDAAIDAAESAHPAWSDMPWQSRAAIFLKAADLAAGPWRDRLNAATMLGQGKTVYQAEIDAACELIDFFRLNVQFMRKIYGDQPISSKGIWNMVEYGALEGFVFAVTPFNFTAIAANLPTAPALMGNTVLWKPSERSVLSAHVVMELLEEAGLPGGVINFLPTDNPKAVGDAVLESPNLSAIHFTGSTPTFQKLWSYVGENITRYRCYPRLVGETGGKDFVFAHPTADIEALCPGLIRGAFEYQGQKCSAASRAYIPSNIWDELTKQLKQIVQNIQVGSPLDFTNFMGPVIDKRAFKEIKAYIDFAKNDPDHEILVGGQCDDHKGNFIRPTIVISSNPQSKLMTEEIFGPVLTLYRYEQDELAQALTACDTTTKYALTGAIFAQDREAIVELTARLRYCAGNFYINDKPTGAVVGQQPFGGARASGTNDKAGSILNLLRWVNVRTIKETFVPAKDYHYPYMEGV
ncbi:MAG: L-glutamate gamma-semialdehyde dehydrogenase [Robiginitomaculum sp.]|nr:L-glutamate gamma-semialdehyde dehydrogenase [Robiginitomaculum sp.]